MTVVAVGGAVQKSRSFASSGPFYQALCSGIHGTNILSIHFFCKNTKGFSPLPYTARRCFSVRGVLRILVILTDVDNWELPQRCHVHDFVQQALPQCSIAEKACRNLIGTSHFARHSGSRGNA